MYFTGKKGIVANILCVLLTFFSYSYNVNGADLNHISISERKIDSLFTIAELSKDVNNLRSLLNADAQTSKAVKVIRDTHESIDTSVKLVGCVTKLGEISPVPYTLSGEDNFLSRWVSEHNKKTSDNPTGISKTGQAGYDKAKVPNISDLYNSGYYIEGKEEAKAKGIPFLPKANSNLAEFDENKALSILKGVSSAEMHQNVPLAGDFGSVVGQGAAWSYTEHYQRLNKFLRGIIQLSGELLKYERQNITELDKVFYCSKIKQPMVVVRGVGSMPEPFEKYFAQGREHIENGFMSTTTKSDIGRQFLSTGGGLIIFELPSGTSAISVWKKKNGEEFSMHPEQEEILLARNTKYKVVRWTVLPDGTKCPVCRIIEDFSH